MRTMACLGTSRPHSPIKAANVQRLHCVSKHWVFPLVFAWSSLPANTSNVELSRLGIDCLHPLTVSDSSVSNVLFLNMAMFLIRFIKQNNYYNSDLVDSLSKYSSNCGVDDEVEFSLCGEQTQNLMMIAESVSNFVVKTLTKDQNANNFKLSTV